MKDYLGRGLIIILFFACVLFIVYTEDQRTKYYKYQLMLCDKSTQSETCKLRVENQKQQEELLMGAAILAGIVIGGRR